MGFCRDQKDWKILNVDCSSSEVTTRQMTDEEKAKYGPAIPNKKIKIGDEEYMKKLKISTEELLEDCKIYGTDWAACKVIGEKRGITQKQVSNLILARGIKKKLALPNELDVEKLEEVKPEIKECVENCEKKCAAIDFSQLEEIEIKQRPKQDYMDALAYGIEFRDKAEAVKPRLKPKMLESQSQYDFIYELFDEYLGIANGNFKISVKWANLDDFIKDLQEVKRIVNE